MLSRLPRRSWSGSISKLRTIVSTRTLATSVCRADHKAYSATLLLPKTSLPLKHKDPVAAEHAYRSRTTDELYKSQVSINHTGADRQWSTNKGELFVLHDGPPYANGHLHMGQYRHIRRSNQADTSRTCIEQDPERHNQPISGVTGSTGPVSVGHWPGLISAMYLVGIVTVYRSSRKH